MSRISEHGINRLVKRILLERNDITINGVKVFIDDTYDSKIYVGNNSYWVTARREGVFDWTKFENAHIISIQTNSIGGVDIKTQKNSIPLNQSETNTLFGELKSGNSKVTHKGEISLAGVNVEYEVLFSKV